MGRGGDRRRQRRACRLPHRCPADRPGARSGPRAGGDARRQHPAYPQPPLRARPGGPLQPGHVPVRRAVAGPVRGRHRTGQREARRADRAGVRDPAAVDDRARGPLAAAADRHAAPGPDQPVLPRRRQGPDQHLPSDRGTAWHSGPLRHHRQRPGHGRRPVPGDGTLRARSVVCASGGFEANIAWLRRYWGDAADNYLIRGSRDNDGLVLAALYAHGAARAGEERGFHSVAIDARSPRFDGGIATRLDSIPFGIVVNSRGRRCCDEGEDLWSKRYAIWGRNIAGQPGQIAYSIWDAKVRRLFLPPMYRPAEAGSVGDLAVALGPDSGAVPSTGREFNAAIRPGGTFDPGGLDDCATEGISPAKSHWAQPLDTPPYYGVAMRPGITFTYLGVAVSEQARVLRTDGTPMRNVFAAGEIMSGNILSTGYLAGFGLTIGHVWGRIAGAEAARHVHAG